MPCRKQSLRHRQTTGIGCSLNMFHALGAISLQGSKHVVPVVVPSPCGGLAFGMFECPMLFDVSLHFCCGGRRGVARVEGRARVEEDDGGYFWKQTHAVECKRLGVLELPELQAWNQKSRSTNGRFGSCSSILKEVCYSSSGCSFESSGMFANRRDFEEEL